MAKTSAKRKPDPTPEHEQRHLSDRAIDAADEQGAESSRSTTTVLVGCKLPNGLVMELLEPGMILDKDGKPAEGRRPAPAGERVILKGANSLRTDRRAAQGEHPYGITTVSKAFWEAWFARNKDFDFVRRGFVFVVERAGADNALADARAISKERRGLRTGLEALALEKDPRMEPGPTPATTVEVDPASMPANREREEPVAV
jgi:hypothetical protein